MQLLTDYFRSTLRTLPQAFSIANAYRAFLAMENYALAVLDVCLRAMLPICTPKYYKLSLPLTETSTTITGSSTNATAIHHAIRLSLAIYHGI